MFSNIATLLTITSKVVLESFQISAQTRVVGYKNILRVDTSMYWIIDLVMDATLNLPDHILEIFVANICRCYESILLQGSNNLLEVVTFVTSIAFKQVAKSHLRSVANIWIRVTKDGPLATLTTASGLNFLYKDY